MLLAYNDVEEKIVNTAKRKTRSYAKRKVRKLNGWTIFFCILALIAGLAVGVYGYDFVCSDDCFVVLGEKENAVELNTVNFTYYDDGVRIVEFGRNISDNVVVETNMTKLGNGAYTVNTTVPGRYYIKYAVDSPKYEKVTKIRTFVVGGAE